MAHDLSVLKDAIIQQANYEASKRVGNEGSGIEYDSRLLVINGQPKLIPDDGGNEERENARGEKWYLFEIDMYDEETRVLKKGIRASFTDWEGDGIPTFVEGMHADVVRLKRKENGKNDWFNLPNMEQGRELGLYTDEAGSATPTIDEEAMIEAAKTPIQLKALADEWGLVLTTTGVPKMKAELRELMGLVTA